MRKDASIIFKVNFNKFDDKSSGKSNRFFSLYRRLRRKRRLARFCREAFIEKASRQLGGLENSYRQLDSLIKSRGVPYILESIRQNEARIGQAGTNADVNSIIQKDTEKETEKKPDTVLQVSEIPEEPLPERQPTEGQENIAIREPELDKLKKLI